MSGTIAAGFNTTSLGRTDDGYSSAISLGFSINFFGNTYSTAFVGNNGFITFGSGSSSYSSRGVGQSYSGRPIIAALYADVDTTLSSSGITAWGTGTYEGHAAFGATWAGVTRHNGGAPQDTFQILLVDRADTGANNFDIYLNYGNIAWDPGAAGFNAGTGGAEGTYYQIPGSTIRGAFVNGGPNALDAGTNDGVPGQYMFEVRNGGVAGITPGSTPTPTSTSTPTPTPTPTSTPTPTPTPTPVPGDFVRVSAATIKVMRFFNQATGDQFLTASEVEASTDPTTVPSLVTESGGFLALDPTVAEFDDNATPVYRFFNTSNGDHFLTASTDESDAIQNTQPNMTYEGVAFYEHLLPQAGDTAVYRFFDTTNGTHFYTSNAAEIASISANQPALQSEGIAFYAPSSTTSS